MLYAILQNILRLRIVYTKCIYQCQTAFEYTKQVVTIRTHAYIHSPSDCCMQNNVKSKTPLL